MGRQISDGLSVWKQDPTHRGVNTAITGLTNCVAVMIDAFVSLK